MAIISLHIFLSIGSTQIWTEKPRKKSEHVINKQLTWMISLIGVKKTGILFATFFITLFLYGSDIARTTLFTGFVLYEFVRIGAIRSQEKLTWFSNKWLLISLAFSVLLQIVIIYTPLNSLFRIVPLGVGPWAILISGVLIGYFIAIWIATMITKYVRG